MKKKNDSISRREFVKKSTQLGLGAMATASALSPMKAFAQIMVGGEDDYDYIVVGSGAGGGPVAANLAKAGFKVLVLEAGGNFNGPNYSIPLFHGASTEDPNMAWNFFVKHYADPAQQKRDTFKYRANEGGILYPRAGTLGGCTAHNAMITLYPDHEDWEAMSNLTQDKSWAASEMRQYFDRVDNASYMKASDQHKRHLEGWLNTEQTNPLLLFKDAKLLSYAYAAVAETKLIKEVLTKAKVRNLMLDPNREEYVNDKKADGVFNIPRATINGRRNGTRELLLNTQAKHRNLEIRYHSLASGILFEDSKNPKRATGIEYIAKRHAYRADPNAAPDQPENARKKVRARYEVILAGGAFNSPQLMMLSGIGDPASLTQFGIPVRHPLPGVGKNLQDRYEVGVVTELRGDYSILKNCGIANPGMDKDPCLADYNRDPKGSLYGTNGVIIARFKKSDPKRPGGPDLAIFGLPGKFQGYYPKWAGAAVSKNHFTWAVLKGHTQNTAGVVTLDSKDPKNPQNTPDINFNYFGEGKEGVAKKLAERDLDDVMRAVKTVRKMNSRTAVKIHTKGEVIPGATVNSDAEIRQFVKDNAWGHHASCSNKMGNDSDSVVDSNFKVHGIEGLRIVDASVFPRVPGLFIVAPIYMIAEKASDVIIRDKDTAVKPARFSI